MMTDEELEGLRKQAARVPILERSLGRQKAVTQELEKRVENRTRELYLAIEKVKRQARLVGARTAIALLGQYGSLLRAAPAMLRESKWEIRPLVRTILTSQAFYSDKAIGAQVKSPIQLVVGTIRLLGLDMPPGRVLGGAALSARRRC